MSKPRYIGYTDLSPEQVKTLSDGIQSLAEKLGFNAHDFGGENWVAPDPIGCRINDDEQLMYSFMFLFEAKNA